jgi:methionyl aminopeptidase
MPRDSQTGFLTPGVISKPLSVPSAIARPEYVGKPSPAEFTGSHIKSADQVEKIRAAGKIAAEAIALVGANAKAGVTTDELDKLAHEYMVSQGAYPSTLGYRGFPKSCCTSINEVICHGIPDDTVLQDGDIMNVDITAFKDGFHGDSNATFLIGDVSKDVADLVERTKEALDRAIAVVMPGRPINVIGRTIESYAKRFNYGVVRDFTGHGIGEAFHSGLVVPHFDAAPNYSNTMEVGMVFTIEPMLTLGTHEWDIWSDNWTVTTKDKSITAQFEHTLVVTESGAEILTLP